MEMDICDPMPLLSVGHGAGLTFVVGGARAAVRYNRDKASRPAWPVR